MGVREFKAADAASWVALTNPVLGRQSAPERLQQEDERHTGLNCRWVYPGAESLLGVARLNAFAFLPPDYYQVSVVVAPAARGRGVGQALWQEVRRAIPAGAAGLSADVLDTDPTSLAWAERRGFQHHIHRFASELDLKSFRAEPYAAPLQQAAAQGVTFTTLATADSATMDRYLAFYADRLTETPDLAGLPRWTSEQVQQVLHFDHDPHPEWLFLALSPTGQWWGTSALVRYGDVAYNELTALHPQARGRGLALPLKLQAIAAAQAAGLRLMRTNNHSENAPMLAVNRRLGFVQQPGKFELRLTL